MKHKSWGPAFRLVKQPALVLPSDWSSSRPFSHIQERAPQRHQLEGGKPFDWWLVQPVPPQITSGVLPAEFILYLNILSKAPYLIKTYLQYIYYLITMNCLSRQSHVQLQQNSQNTNLIMSSRGNVWFINCDQMITLCLQLDGSDEI